MLAALAVDGNPYEDRDRLRERDSGITHFLVGPRGLVEGWNGLENNTLSCAELCHRGS